MHQILNDVLKERAMQRLCVIARKELAFVPGVTVIDVKATGDDADRPEAFPPTSFTVNTIGWGPTLHRRCRRFRIGLPHDGTDLTDERFASALRTSAATQAALAAYARRVGVDAPLDPRIGTDGRPAGHLTVDVRTADALHAIHGRADADRTMAEALSSITASRRASYSCDDDAYSDSVETGAYADFDGRTTTIGMPVRLSDERSRPILTRTHLDLVGEIPATFLTAAPGRAIGDFIRTGVTSIDRTRIESAEIKEGRIRLHFAGSERDVMAFDPTRSEGRGR